MDVTRRERRQRDLVLLELDDRREHVVVCVLVKVALVTEDDGRLCTGSVEVQAELPAGVGRGQRCTGVPFLRPHGVEQVPDHFVAAGSDADALAGAHQGANHLRTDVGLAGTRRPLNGQRRTIERCRQTHGEGGRRFASALTKLS